MGLVALGEEQALEELQKNELQNWKKIVLETGPVSSMAKMHSAGNSSQHPPISNVYLMG